VGRPMRLCGVANAAPVDLSHLVGGRSLPHVQLVSAIVFLLLIADVLLNARFVAANCGNEIFTPQKLCPA
jgi:hypothetical protein